MFLEASQLNYTDKYMLSDGTKLGKFIGITEYKDSPSIYAERDNTSILKSYNFYNEANFSKYSNSLVIFLIGLQLDTSK